MAQQPRGRPPSQAPPPAGRGRNALTALGGGVLVLAVAGGAWVLFGRDSTKSPTTAVGPNVPTAASANPVFGPVAPGTTPKPTATVTPTSTGTVAATKPAATPTPKATPTKAVVRTAAPVPPKAPAVKAPTPPAAGSQQGGTVAKKAYTFRVARGDTLWNLTERALSDTGRSTSNANIVTHLQKFYAQNIEVIGLDPNFIVPGQQLIWPAGL